MASRIKGILSPVLTPFKTNLEPDVVRYIAHCKWLVANNVGLAIFGTNSEATSLSVSERQALLDKLLEAGVPAGRMMPGTGACSLTDAVVLTKHAVENGVAGCLMLPPFFFKGVSDEGLFAYYAEVIERVADARLKVYLYHIPALSGVPITLRLIEMLCKRYPDTVVGAKDSSGVPITLRLIEMLCKRYPDTVVGAKDSSGVWDNTKAMIDNFAKDGFDVFPASESLLTKALSIGGAGCISATVNMNPTGIRAVYDGWNGADGVALQAKADVVRQIFSAVPMIPVMKRVAAEFSGQMEWSTVRPPFVKMDETTFQTVLAQLKGAGFDMPNFPKV